MDKPSENLIDKTHKIHAILPIRPNVIRIVLTFRDLEQPTIDAITLFGNKNTKNVVLEKSYEAYMEGYTDQVTGEARCGYLDIVKELQQRFPNPAEIIAEKDKKDFVKLFGEYLRADNIL